MRPRRFSPYRNSPRKRRFQEKGEDALHRQRLPDDAAGGLREFRPIGAELKFHGDAGDHAEGKVDAENLGPETRGAVVMLVTGAQRQRLQDNHQQRQAHRELRK